jgi:hypothetical protein
VWTPERSVWRRLVLVSVELGSRSAVRQEEEHPAAEPLLAQYLTLYGSSAEGRGSQKRRPSGTSSVAMTRVRPVRDQERLPLGEIWDITVCMEAACRGRKYSV